MPSLTTRKTWGFLPGLSPCTLPGIQKLPHPATMNCCFPHWSTGSTHQDFQTQLPQLLSVLQEVSTPGRVIPWEESLLLLTGVDGKVHAGGQSLCCSRAGSDGCGAGQICPAQGRAVLPAQLQLALQHSQRAQLKHSQPLIPSHPTGNAAGWKSSSCCVHQAIHGSPHENQCSAQEQLQWWPRKAWCCKLCL